MNRRIRLIVEYIGTAYCGWQIQANGLSVQQVVTEAIAGMVGHAVTLVGSSRTDARVHALGMVAHFDTTEDIPTFGFLRGLNTVLPTDIRVIDVADAAPSFHAQKDAKEKWYRYLIFHAPHASAVLANRSWHRFRPLNVPLMHEASQCLVGRHDFSAYCAYDDQNKSKVRTVLELGWSTLSLTPPLPRGERDGVRGVPGAVPMTGTLVACDIRGAGFLKQMVRNIVGTVVEVGEARRPPESVKEALDSRQRAAAGLCAPPEGLYLVRVEY